MVDMAMNGNLHGHVCGDMRNRNVMIEPRDSRGHSVRFVSALCGAVRALNADFGGPRKGKSTPICPLRSYSPSYLLCRRVSHKAPTVNQSKLSKTYLDSKQTAIEALKHTRVRRQPQQEERGLCSFGREEAGLSVKDLNGRRSPHAANPHGRFSQSHAVGTRQRGKEAGRLEKGPWKIRLGFSCRCSPSQIKIPRRQVLTPIERDIAHSLSPL